MIEDIRRMHGTRIAVGVTVVAIAVLQAARAVSSQPSAPPQSAGVIIDRASAYLTSYQKAVALLVADEVCVQQVEGDGLSRGMFIGQPRQRTTRGEIFLTYLVADRRWVALHDIAEVDGKPVEGREDLRALLAVSSVQSVAGRLFQHNARYNIGRIRRNFNEPTLALHVIGSPSRFDFRLESTGGAAAGSVRTVTFRERQRPTIVYGLNGQPVFSSGELLVEPDTGVVRHTRIAFRHESIDAELTTTFTFNERLDLWLPSRLVERYGTGSGDGRSAESVTAESRYENYRRFEGRARIAN